MNVNFSEKDVYEIINNHFIEELKNSDSVIYWNNRILKSPKFEYTFAGNEEIPMFVETSEPFPIFTKEYWKIDKIRGVSIIEWKEFNSYFIKNDLIDLENLWNLKYQNKYLHNVSYPIYNSETKIAVIKDYIYKPFMNCGYELKKIYSYEKTEIGWKKMTR